MIEVGAGVNLNELTKNAVQRGEKVLIMENYQKPSSLKLPNNVKWVVNGNFEDYEANMVICSHVLEHISPHHSESFFRGLISMTKNELVIKVPHKNTYYSNYFGHFTYYNLFSFDGWITRNTDLQTYDSLPFKLTKKINYYKRNIFSKFCDWVIEKRPTLYERFFYIFSFPLEIEFYFKRVGNA